MRPSRKGPQFMRNYCKLKALKWTRILQPINNQAPIYAFAEDEDALMEIKRRYEAIIRAQFTPGPFTVSFAYPYDPQDIYVLLDKVFVAQMANRDAAGFWQDSVLGLQD